MAEETRHIVIAPRAAALESVPGDWQEQVAGTPGVTVLGSAFGRMQVRATSEALESATRKLGHALHFEEVAPRGFAG
jgi:hypothetical protein